MSLDPRRIDVLDVLDDQERRNALDAIGRVLTPDGLLLMSSHNRAFAPRIASPWHLRGKGRRARLRSLNRLPRWWWNRQRVLPFEVSEQSYAVLNDISQDFAALHYYITRNAQERQLAEHGFELLECLDLDGRPVGPEDEMADCAELHYVARRARTMLEEPAA